MTRGTWLHWSSDGIRHVHSDEEMARASKDWRPGASCADCPHVEPQWETTEMPVETSVDKPGGET